MREEEIASAMRRKMKIMKIWECGGEEKRRQRRYEKLMIIVARRCRKNREISRNRRR